HRAARVARSFREPSTARVLSVFRFLRCGFEVKPLPLGRAAQSSVEISCRETVGQPRPGRLTQSPRAVREDGRYLNDAVAQHRRVSILFSTKLQSSAFAEATADESPAATDGCASRSRPASNRQAVQSRSGASAKISAPHFRQILSTLLITGDSFMNSPSCTAPNSIIRYARNTAIKWRSSSSISLAMATV